MKLLSAAEVAADIGCTPQTVRRLARDNNIGTLVSGAWVFNAGDRDTLSKLLGCPAIPRRTATTRKPDARKENRRDGNAKRAKKAETDDRLVVGRFENQPTTTNRLCSGLSNDSH